MDAPYCCATGLDARLSPALGVWPQIAPIEDDDRAGVECGCSLPRGVGGVICAADYSI